MTNPSPSSVPVEEPTTNELLNAFEKAACILHEANLEVGETDEDFDWDSAHERYDDARQALKDALSLRDLSSRSPSPPVEAPEKLDEETERLISVLPRLAQALTGHTTVKILPLEEMVRLDDTYCAAVDALRSRIRTLVSEARQQEIKFRNTRDRNTVQPND